MYDETLFLGIGLYDIFLVLACLSALVVFDKFSKLRNMSVEANKFYYILGLAAIVGGIFSAMLFQSVYNWIDNGFQDFKFQGLTFLGGVIGGALIFLLGHFFVAKKEVQKELWKVAEIAPACVFFAHGVGRIGCFFGGCCGGIETDFFLGITFPEAPHKTHPTQLYESAFLFAMFFVILYMNRKDIRYSLPVYCLSYGVFRFLLEFLRGDERGALVPGLSPSQMMSIILVAVGLGLLALKYFREKYPEKMKYVLSHLFEQTENEVISKDQQENESDDNQKEA